MNLEFFDKQLKIADFSEDFQEYLLNSKSLVIGAGGIGCPLIIYLSSSGFGDITIFDGDKIEASNLQRQFMYSEKDCGEFTLQRDLNRTGVFPLSCDIDVRDHNLFNSKIWTLTPKNGDVYMFPSSTIHNVGKNKTNNDRHSLAFNVHVKGKLGTKEFQLDIK